MGHLELNPSMYQLSEEENDKIFKEKIIGDIFKNVSSLKNPIAIIFGGQPGAGKSAAMEIAEEELKNFGDVALIIGDDLRIYHKKYRELLKTDDKTAAFYTDHDSGKWIEKAIAHAKNIRCNLIIEGTMRVPEKVANTMKSLRNAGYTIDARALAVNKRFSWQGVLQRYEKQCASPRACGRMTTSESHQAAYDGMLKTLEKIEQEKLADKITIYKRGAVILYENELENYQWKNPPQANMILEQERNRPWTLSERVEYAKGFDKLVKMLQEPKRAATKEEISAMEKLRREAYREVSVEVEPEN